MILFDLKTLGELKKGFFIKRQNRFLATAKVDEEIKKIHIADTGRLEEILTPKRELLLLKNAESLKTDYTLVAAKMEEGWVLINTKLHPAIAHIAIKNGVLGFKPEIIKKEVRFLNSRFDYKADNAYVELKGCSLVQNGFCLFPNAPTSRGTKHIKELIEAKKRGYEAYILIMALRRCKCFKPHPERDGEFKKTFYTALNEGVKFKGFFIKIDEELRVVYDGELNLCQS
ncbi:DNA/RNA nuclease SfsA [Nitrosophilus alvini]|uniref:DNA/RNA nuclease SfsA n=1 Tax=Nitrosophilus alvini TaxID=2714855 RepID=UPI00190B02B1|nr:DNA/RNA nuclease SfsA [Nitrosophilus alvini]